MRIPCLLLALVLPLAAVAAPLAQAYHLGGKCVSLIEGGDIAYRLCLNRNNPDCLVYVERETFLGTETHCVGVP